MPGALSETELRDIDVALTNAFYTVSEENKSEVPFKPMSIRAVIREAGVSSGPRSQAFVKGLIDDADGDLDEVRP